jgi:hypothetical protein
MGFEIFILEEGRGIHPAGTWEAAWRIEVRTLRSPTTIPAD